MKWLFSHTALRSSVSCVEFVGFTTSCFSNQFPNHHHLCWTDWTVRMITDACVGWCWSVYACMTTYANRSLINSHESKYGSYARFLNCCNAYWESSSSSLPPSPPPPRKWIWQMFMINAQDGEKLLLNSIITNRTWALTEFYSCNMSLLKTACISHF